MSKRIRRITAVEFEIMILETRMGLRTDRFYQIDQIVFDNYEQLADLVGAACAIRNNPEAYIYPRAVTTHTLPAPAWTSRQQQLI